MTDKFLINYIAGQASENDIVAVEKWVSESDENRNELSRIKNSWILAGLNKQIDAGMKERELEQILLKVQAQNQSLFSKMLQLNWQKYAAILILFLCFSATVGYFAFNSGINRYNSAHTEFIVPNGERSNIILPDGSEVQLNGGSTLRFNPSLNRKQRKVFLNGEAFFKVTHDESRPFLVETSLLQVEVLGTCFNVSSYDDDPNITTFLKSGKVKVKLNGGKEVLLKPKEALQFDKSTKKLHKLINNDTRFFDWTKGILTIRGETIGNMSKKLERRFGIEIVFGDEEVRNHTYTGSIKDEDLSTVLRALTFTSSIKYERNGNKLILYSMK